MELELREQMRLFGVSIIDVSKRVNRSYSTVASWVNSYAPIPVEVHQLICEMIQERRAILAGIEKQLPLRKE